MGFEGEESQPAPACRQGSVTNTIRMPPTSRLNAMTDPDASSALRPVANKP